MKQVCDTYHESSLNSNRRTISIDEKTGIQALERKSPHKPLRPGKPERIEFEYIRHGTLSLIANFDVVTGKIISPTLGKTRNEKDFYSHIKRLLKSSPETDEWVFVTDQLNTHMSESIVRLVAKYSGIKDDLGVKGKTGILKSKKSRKEFLVDTSHSIRFVYTPKHCSWLNQIEIWFGILVRKLLKRGNFLSKEDLKRKILHFITYFNKTMVKPYKWTFDGLPLKA